MTMRTERGQAAELFEQSLHLHQTGSLEEAALLYQNILAETPNHADALHLLGVIAQQQGRTAEALERIGQALAQQPDSSIFRSNFALALRSAGRLDEAVDHLRQALQTDPAYSGARKNLAAILQQLGRLDEAAEQLEELVRRGPGKVGPVHSLALVRLKQGRPADAEPLLRRALTLQPDHADAHNNLAVALKELRKHAEAEEHAQRAVALRPEAAGYRSNLAQVLSERGRHQEALQTLRELVQLEPASVAARNQLAVALKQVGQLAEAEDHLRQALAQAPGDLATRTNLGDILTGRGNCAEALTHLQEALRLDPGHAEVHNNIAMALKGLDRGAEMLPYLQRALELNPRYTPALNNMASSLITRGDVAAGTEMLQRVLHIDAKDIPALFTLAISTKHEFGDAEVQCMEALLRQPEQSAVNRELLHFALAAVLDKKGVHARAFEHALEANRLKQASYRNRGVAFERRRQLSLVEEILRCFASFEGLPNSGSDDETPVFIVGMPRSGTTLVEQILASHPAVHGAGELNDVARLAAELPEFLDAAAPFPMCLRRLTSEQASVLATRHLQHLRELANGAARVVDKMTVNFLYLGLIALLFPKARIIHCRRDPRDTCLSCFFHNFASIGLNFTFDLGDLGFYYRQYERLMEHWRRVLPLRLFDIQYEELVGDQEKWTRSLLDFCGLPWNERCLAFHETNRPVKTASALQVRQPIYSKSIGRWKMYENELQPLSDALAAEPVLPPLVKHAVSDAAFTPDIAVPRKLKEATPQGTRPAPTFPIALYALLYGDHVTLHRRLLDSLRRSVNDSAVTVTLWCNQVCAETLRMLRNTPYRLIVSDENVPKYKAMRKMFAEGIPGDWIVWFDDDSYITASDWLPHMRRYIRERAAENICYIGPMHFGRHVPGVTEFAKQATWYRGRAATTYEGHTGTPFVLGAYWWLRGDVQRLLDWPDPRLNHNGGDTLLGDAVWQQQLPLHNYCYGALVNVAPRRGFREPNAGLQRDVNAADVSAWLDQAIAQHQAGKLDEAEVGYLRVLHRQPSQPDALHLYGVLAHQRGRHADAVEWIERAIAANPRDAAYHSNYGLALRSLERREEAAAALERAIELDPNYTTAHKNLGIVLRELGRLPQAKELLRQLLTTQPREAAVWRNLGDVLLGQARYAEAVDAFQQALALKPGDPDTHNNLGVAYKELSRLEESEASYRESLRLRPDHAATRNNLGIVLSCRDKPQEALACFTEALRLEPDFADARHNLGAALGDLGRHEEAIAQFQAVLAKDRRQAECHNSLGASLQVLGNTHEALACYERALQLQSDHVWGHFNRSQALLLLGRFEEGWPEWEWRLRRPGVQPRPYSQPAWDGAPLPNRTLLLYTEQGLGDTLQFIRLVRQARERVGRVVVECQPALVPLLRRIADIDVLIPKGQPLPSFDAHAALLSLPGILHLRSDTIPCDVPYLSADPALVEKWQRRLAGFAGLRVGIAWQGNPKYKRDAFRSIPLAEFAPLAEVPGVQLISLQKGFGNEQLAQLTATWPTRPVVLGDDVDEAAGAFMDTAAIMRLLDLVITSDTAMPHLAGALGVPVWLAVPHAPDWRWLLEGESCPWYPSMRLYRQPALADWATVFRNMRDDLDSLRTKRFQSCMTIDIQVSAGELLDRLSICQIKSDRIRDILKRANVLAELTLLEAVRARTIPDSPALAELAATLKSVNERLWEVEDAIRDCERNQDFGPSFIELARSIYRNNDERARLKRAISEIVGSPLVEEKSYSPYA